MSLLGFPECLAKAPYEEQPERLFVRLDLLQVIAGEDRRWLEHLDYATEKFQRGGEWPADPVAMEAILVLGEIDVLVRHAAGEDVSVLMARTGIRKGRLAPGERGSIRGDSLGST